MIPSTQQLSIDGTDLYTLQTKPMVELSKSQGFLPNNCNSVNTDADCEHHQNPLKVIKTIMILLSSLVTQSVEELIKPSQITYQFKSVKQIRNYGFGNNAECEIVDKLLCCTTDISKIHDTIKTP